MALQAQLSVDLNVSSLLGPLTGDLGDALEVLGGIELPLDVESLGAVGSLADGLDVSELGPVAEQAGAALLEVLEKIPAASDLVGGLTALAEIAKQIAEVDLEGDVSRLLDALGSELDDQGDGALASLLRLANGLGGSTPTLLRSVYGLFERLGAAPELGRLSLPDLLPGILTGVRSLGALMSLETLLADAERLARAVAGELDPTAVRLRERDLVVVLESLPARLQSLDVGDLAAVELVARDVAGVRLAAVAHVRAIAESMGFGEGTLSYIDFPRLVGEIETLLGTLRTADLSALERAVASVAEKLAPLLSFDLSGAPRFTLDALLAQIEARMQTLAGEVATADLSPIQAPLADGLGRIQELSGALVSQVKAVELAVTGALETVRQAVESVPLAPVTQVIQSVASALSDVLEQVTDVLGGIDQALDDAVAALNGALATVESAVDTFKSGIEGAFGAAQARIAALDLDAVAGQISDNIAQFAEVVQKADLSPCFSTASGAIDSAASVVEAVPFSLLPDSMESEVVAVCKPIKQTNVEAFRQEIQKVLQIGDDGTFTLRPGLEAALSSLQQAVDTLLETLREHEPKQLVAQLAEPFDELRAKIADVSPAIDLGPVRDAIASIHATVETLDPQALLGPIDAGFDAVLDGVDTVKPGALLQGIDEPLRTARDKVVAAIHLQEAKEKLDELQELALEQLARLDLSKLETQIESGLEEIRGQIQSGVRLGVFDGLGSVIASLLAGAGQQLSSLSFAAVVDWLTGSAAGQALEGRTSRALAHVELALASVQAVDPQPLADLLTTRASALSVAIEAKPAGPGKARLSAAFSVADPAADLARIAANRGRYLATLESAKTAASQLRDAALTEADAIAARVRKSFSPLSDLAAPLRALQDIFGVSLSPERGFAGILIDVLDQLPPRRIAELTSPVYRAIRDRVEQLLKLVLDPARQAVTDLQTVFDALDLDVALAGLDAIHAEIRGKIESLRPSTLLAEPLAAFTAARDALLAFDPLGAVTDALEGAREAALRVTDKLDPQSLVATPQAIFDEILGAFAKLDVGQLLAPLLEQLDAIASQIDTGLEDTVASFQRLQDALPDKIGSTSISASVSVTVS